MEFEQLKEVSIFDNSELFVNVKILIKCDLQTILFLFCNRIIETGDFCTNQLSNANNWWDEIILRNGLFPITT